jgi:2-polyprenyl-6-hydroxyphenyl methylase / 3-demethylubiquinone-9 3-methyltransferase
MNQNNIKYSKDHWSEGENIDVNIRKYIEQYRDPYNRNNILNILDQIDNNRSLNILDYGGGLGMLTFELSGSNHNITLVDAAPRAIESAKIFHQKYGEGDLRIKYQVCSYAHELIGNKYDIIIAKDLIEHVKNDVELIKDFKNLLVDGGKLILTTQNKFSLNYLLEAGIRFMMNPRKKWMGWDRTHLRFYTPRSLRKLLEYNGFKGVGFNSTYNVPYKLIDLFTSKTLNKKLSLFKNIDRKITQRNIFNKTGWNILVFGRNN